MLKNRLSPPDVQDVEDKGEGANLDALMAEAGINEQAGQAEQRQAQEKIEQREADTLAADLADTLRVVAAILQPAIWWLSPAEFAALWGEQVQASIAGSGAEIMRRHGLTMGDVMSQYGPYIALGGALAPSTLATVRAYKNVKTAQALQQRQGTVQGAGDGATA